MTRFSPFSLKSKAWEVKAEELREIAKCARSEKLCPWKLAQEVGLKVIDANDVLPILSTNTRSILGRLKGDRWSGGVLPKPTEDGYLICMLNPYQSRHRQKVTLMEEVSHIHLDHRPATILRKTESGMQVREYDKSVEEEAYGVGAAALLPWSTFFHALDKGLDVFQLSDVYDVSQDLVKYRIKVTGATSLFHSRQKRKAI